MLADQFIRYFSVIMTIQNCFFFFFLFCNFYFTAYRKPQQRARTHTPKLYSNYFKHHIFSFYRFLRNSINKLKKKKIPYNLAITLKLIMKFITLTNLLKMLIILIKLLQLHSSDFLLFCSKQFRHLFSYVRL